MISVVMPVCNGEKYLKEAIESILNQTYRDFEFIIVNDGSTDKTEDIILSYHDPRIRYVKNKTNLQIVKTFNKGIKLSCGKYIARMDADDISLPNRLEKQVSFLEKHKEIGVLGTWIENTNKDKEHKACWFTPVSPELVRWSLYFGTCIAHPTVIIQRNIIEKIGGYNPEFSVAEDYEFWVRASHITNLSNLPQVLLKRRIHDNNISLLKTQEMEKNDIKIMRLAISNLLNSSVSEKEVSELRRYVRSCPLNVSQIKSVYDLMQKMFRAYLELKPLSNPDAKEISDDVVKKLLSLAALAGKVSVFTAIDIYFKAIKINPQIFLSRFISGIIRSASRRLR